MNTKKMIKLKDLIKEAAWDHTPGKALPTLEDVQKAYQAKQGNGQCNCGPTNEGGECDCDCGKDDEDKDVNIYEAYRYDADQVDKALDKIYKVLYMDLRLPPSKASTLTDAIEKLLRKIK